MLDYNQMITSEQKVAAVKKVTAKSKDSGGESAQAAIMTERIKQLTEHLKDNQHDYMARRGLLQLVGKRRRLLRYVARKDSADYLRLIKELGIRR